MREQTDGRTDRKAKTEGPTIYNLKKRYQLLLDCPMGNVSTWISLEWNLYLNRLLSVYLTWEMCPACAVYSSQLPESRMSQPEIVTNWHHLNNRITNTKWILSSAVCEELNFVFEVTLATTYFLLVFDKDKTKWTKNGYLKVKDFTICCHDRPNLAQYLSKCESRELEWVSSLWEVWAPVSRFLQL